MFKNYFKTALRQLANNKLFSVLNILGLAMGLCGSILIFLWVQDEKSFDRQHPAADAIFRLNSGLGAIKTATSPIGMAPFLQRTVPQVRQVVRFWAADPLTISYGEKHFIEKKIWYADSNYQQLFHFPLVKGDPRHIFEDKKQLFITERTARRYFGDQEPIGKLLRVGAMDMAVTGVLKDLPENSHIQFDFLMPISMTDQSDLKNNPWDNFIYYSYLRLDPTTANDPAAIARLEKQFAGIYAKNGVPMLKPTFSLQRLTDIHLGEDHLLMDVPGGGSLQYVHIFSLVAIFVLVIACINFMNLSTALSSRRAKEVGLRKTIGALRWQLVAQFLGEAVLLAFLALGVGVVLVGVLMPLFNDLTGKHFSLQALGGSRILLLLGIAVVVGLVSGSYPAFVLSRFQPVKVLKGMKLFQPGKAYFRNGLVVLQFTIAITLMVGTLVVYRQLQFIRNRDLGFDKSNLLYVNMPLIGFDEMQKGARKLDVAIANEPGIISHTVVGDLPTYLTSGDGSITWPGRDPKDQIIFPLLGADENTLNVFGMHLLQGRTFSKAYGSDDSAIVVNEAALRVMHMDPATAVGKTITFNDRKTTIIGVVRNFNFKPVQFDVEPLLMPYHFSRGYDFLVVKAAPGETQRVIDAVKKQFGQVFPESVFDYGFVDKDLDTLYTSEQQMGHLFNVFSLIAIFISCLGLFGLSAYTTQRRFKEIGVRKVLGASVQGIVGLLAKEFLLPVSLATLIAFPLAAWGMEKWLHVFAYRIGLEWWFFAIAGGLALLVALCTVSFQSIQAATANPVKALRTE